MGVSVNLQRSRGRPIRWLQLQHPQLVLDTAAHQHHQLWPRWSSTAKTQRWERQKLFAPLSGPPNADNHLDHSLERPRMEKNNNCLKEQHLSIFLEEHHFYLEQGLAERCVIIIFFFNSRLRTCVCSFGDYRLCRVASPPSSPQTARSRGGYPDAVRKLESLNANWDILDVMVAIFSSHAALGVQQKFSELLT